MAGRSLKALVAQGMRFIVSGGINTAATLLLYNVLLTWLSPRHAYAVSFAAGVIAAYVLNLRFVFRAGHSAGKLIAFPLVYLFVFFVGAGILDFSINHLNIDARVAPLVSIACTLPLSFLLTRWLLLSKPTDIDSRP